MHGSNDLLSQTVLFCIDFFLELITLTASLLISVCGARVAWLCTNVQCCHNGDVTLTLCHSNNNNKCWQLQDCQLFFMLGAKCKKMCCYPALKIWLIHKCFQLFVISSCLSQYHTDRSICFLLIFTCSEVVLKGQWFTNFPKFAFLRTTLSAGCAVI